MLNDETPEPGLGGDASLTPADLVAKRFPKRAVGGYAPKRVDEYLRRVADVLDTVKERARRLGVENEDMKRRLAEYRQREATLQNALASSQKFAEDTLDTSKRQAEAIVAEARLQKEKLLLEAERLPEQLGAEIRRLKEQRAQLRQELTTILETHTALLQQGRAFPVRAETEPPFELEPASPNADEIGEK